MKSFSARLWALLLFIASLASAQTAISSTTLAAAVGLRDDTVAVASATGIAARGLQTATMLYVNREAMRVIAVNGVVLGVERGSDGTSISTHASGSKVFFGVTRAFSAGTPAGYCTSADEEYLPRIVLQTGVFWSCINGKWRPYTGSWDNVGTPGTGVVAREFGNDNYHVTQLTLSNAALGTAASAALGIGKLIYTLPAGAVVVKASNISVGLAGSGTGCDANTPVVGLGTVIASGAVSVLSGTATFQNIMAGAATADVNSTPKLNTVGTVLAIEAASAHTVHFNAAVTWSGACDVTATGTVIIEWTLAA